MFRCHTLQGLEDYLHSTPGDASTESASPHQPCPEACAELAQGSDRAQQDVPAATLPATFQPSKTQPTHRPFNPDEANREMEQALNSDDQTSPAATGRPIILPASYTGNLRHWQQCHLDAMALVQHCGSKPDLFITFTANPSWPEVTANLRVGETASNRHGLVCRVFNQKLRSVLHDIISKKKNTRARHRLDILY